MVQRRRFKQKQSFEDRLASYAETARKVAALLQPGAEKRRTAPQGAAGRHGGSLQSTRASTTKIKCRWLPHPAYGRNWPAVPQKKPERPFIKPGTKVLAGELVCETVARRYETAHVADSQRSSDSLFKNKRSRRIAKGDGLGLRLVCKLNGKLSTLVSELVGVLRRSGEYRHAKPD